MKVLILLFIILLLDVNCKLPFFNLQPRNKRLSQEPNITYIYGHLNPDTDSICSALVLADYLKQTGSKNIVIPCRVGELNKETKYALNKFNATEPQLIIDPSEADEVILVDHNEPSQSLNFKNAKVVGLIDHHAISGFYTKDPINIITKPIGCTSTILYELYKSNGIEISYKIAGLIVSAIISDTLLLKSAITTQDDIDAVGNLSAKYKIPVEDYGRELLSVGSDVSDLTEEQIIKLDSKSYEVNGYKIQIAFLNSVDVESLLKQRKSKLLNEINIFNIENKKQLFTLVIVDIFNFNSTVLASGEYVNVVEKAFNVTLVDNEAFLKGITSRKKQVYPKIAEIFYSLPEYNNDEENFSINIRINLILIVLMVFIFI
jgi:manganese-dependent inorganic pyrophosphatase